MIHEHDIECTSFCSAALPPERQDYYQYAADAAHVAVYDGIYCGAHGVIHHKNGAPQS